MSLFHKQISLIGSPDRWQNFSESGPFWYLVILFGITTFLYFILTCLKNGRKLKNSKNSLKISINFTCHMDFALICTILLGFAWNWRFQLQKDSTPFCILWPNVHKFFYNNFFTHQSESLLWSEFWLEFVIESLWRKKNYCIL